MPVKIGISDTKFSSKKANWLAKTVETYNGVCFLDSRDKQFRLLKQLEVGDIWGIGRQIIRQFLLKQRLTR